MINSCTAISLNEGFDFPKLYEFCEYNYNTQLFKEVLIVNFQDQEFHIFEFGAIILWGSQGYNPDLFFSQIKNFFQTSKHEKTIDYFKVSTSDELNENFQVRRDQLILNSNDPKLRIAISFAMAQSVKLSELEDFVMDELSVHSDIPQQLAKDGDLKLPRKKMAKIRGRIFVTESKINLNYDLLDKPEFLWDHPEYDEHYNKTYEYLEVGQRISVLNKKLSVLRDILNILADELQFKHSTQLEWTIIILIAIEIIITLTEHSLKLF